MSRKFKLVFTGIVALQVAVLLGFIGYKETTLRLGTTVLLQNVPVDPRDLFRGDYVVLRYEVSTVEGYYYGQYAQGDTVYVPLIRTESPGGDATWKTAGYLTVEPEPGWEVFLKGKVADVAARQDGVARITVEYGIEQYFVPEATGHEIETARDVKAEVAVDGFGHAVIKQLIVDGKPWQPK